MFTLNRRFWHFLRSDWSLFVTKRVQLDLIQCAHHLGNCILMISLCFASSAAHLESKLFEVWEMMVMDSDDQQPMH